MGRNIELPLEALSDYGCFPHDEPASQPSGGQSGSQLVWMQIEDQCYITSRHFANFFFPLENLK